MGFRRRDLETEKLNGFPRRRKHDAGVGQDNDAQRDEQDSDSRLEIHTKSGLTSPKSNVPDRR